MADSNSAMSNYIDVHENDSSVYLASIADWFLADGIWILVTVLGAAFLLWALRHWILRWLSALITRMTPEGEDWSRGVKTAHRIVFWLGSAVILAAAILLILYFAGVDIQGVTNGLRSAGDTIVDWLRSSGIRVAIVLIVAFILQQVIRSVVPHIVYGHVTRREKKKRFIEEAEQRAETLSHFLSLVAVTIIWVVAVFMILPEFKVDIGPLLAGAGIVGIAIGFGAQNLIRDLISGIFIIIEDQYAKGDWIQVGAIDGEVEYLGLRRTVLRDFNGTHHTIPNGEIKISSNYSKDWACVNIDIPVAYGEDLDRVTKVIDEVSITLAQEDQWRKTIIETPRVLRVQNFGESGIDMKLWGRTKPMWQWAITGELRKRVKKRFDEEGIEIPWPHVKLYFGEPTNVDMIVKRKSLESEQ